MGKISTLMYGWEFPPKISGGLGVACYAIVKELAKKGVALHLVLPYTAPQNDFDHVNFIGTSQVSNNFNHELPGVNIKSLKIATSISPYARGLGMGLSGDLVEDFLLLLSQLSLPEVMKAIISSIVTQDGNLGMKDHYEVSLLTEVLRYAQSAGNLGNTIDHDIIHAHDWLTYSPAVAAKQVSGKPLVVHLHATEFDRSGEHINQDVYNIEHMGMHAADRVIAVSNLTRQIAIERYGVDANKINTVYNAVEPTNAERLIYKRHVKEKVVTFLGRVTFQKGPDYFVEAAYKVIQKDQNIRFVMAGSGDMLNRMIKRVASLGISTKFHFTGFLKGEEVNHMFSISDVYVMPSVSEPFGISPLEAMRSNVPVIISKQSGVAEILHHAIKVNFWDIDAMADSIYGLVHYPGLSKMFINHGKSEVDKLKWENAAFEVSRIYKEMLNQ